MRALLLAVFFLLSSTVQAGVVSIDFVYAQFLSLNSGQADAPSDLITGSVSYEAQSLDGPLEKLLSFDMTIGSTIYSFADVGAGPSTDNQPIFFIGGLMNGIDRASFGSEDFVLSINPAALVSDGQIDLGPLQYTVSGVNDAWVSAAFAFFPEFVDTPAQVPEPAPLALVGLGMVGLFAARKRALKN